MGPAHSQGVRDRSPHLSPLPRRDAGGRLHHRGPRHPPHPRAPWRLGSPRDPGPRSASRSRRGSRFTLIPPDCRGRRQRPGAGGRAEACLGHDPTRRDSPDGARMTPADRTAAIREPAAGGRRRPTALPRPLGSLAPLRARIKVPILESPMDFDSVLCPKCGSPGVIDVNYTQTTPNGPMVVTGTTVKGTKSNTSFRTSSDSTSQKVPSNTASQEVMTGKVTKVNPKYKRL